MKYPYSDDFMIYDYVNHRYVLTAKDVTDNLEIDIFTRMKNAKAVDMLLRQVSMQVYNYIHQYNTNNKAQDFVIAKTKDGRRIIKDAMEQQLIYFLTNGDLSRSTDEKKRALWFDTLAKEILYQEIKELGTNICYQGWLKVIPTGDW